MLEFISVIHVFSGNFRLYLSRETKSSNNGSVKVHLAQHRFFYVVYAHIRILEPVSLQRSPWDAAIASAHEKVRNFPARSSIHTVSAMAMDSSYYILCVQRIPLSVEIYSLTVSVTLQTLLLATLYGVLFKMNSPNLLGIF